MILNTGSAIRFGERLALMFRLIGKNKNIKIQERNGIQENGTDEREVVEKNKFTVTMTGNYYCTCKFSNLLKNFSVETELTCKVVLPGTYF